LESVYHQISTSTKSPKSTMSESPKEAPVSLDKETVPIAPANNDVELGDRGIIVRAAPLARQLKGRHMQMIAIGNILLRPGHQF